MPGALDRFSGTLAEERAQDGPGLLRRRRLGGHAHLEHLGVYRTQLSSAGVETTRNVRYGDRVIELNLPKGQAVVLDGNLKPVT